VANSTTPEKQSILSPAAVVIGVLIVMCLAGFWYLEKRSNQSPPPPPPLSGDARAYVRNLQLMDVDMKAHESYVKQALVEITGKIGNNGQRVLQVVEINCVFYDPSSLVVLRHRVPIVNQKMGSLAPGEIKPFRLAFDDIPESWNQAMPQMVIANIVFE
jgi:hypothetical protein